MLEEAGQSTYQRGELGIAEARIEQDAWSQNCPGANNVLAGLDTVFTILLKILDRRPLNFAQGLEPWVALKLDALSVRTELETRGMCVPIWRGRPGSWRYSPSGHTRRSSRCACRREAWV